LTGTAGVIVLRQNRYLTKALGNQQAT